jgi:hypothetical protein
MKEETMKGKYMMGTQAFHLLGDISRNEPDLCYVTKDIGDSYFGHWVEGFGFVEVRFPKETTRELTETEVVEYDGKGLVISGQYIGKIEIGEEN